MHTFDIKRFLAPAKVKWIEGVGYMLTNGDQRIFERYWDASNAARN